VGIAKNSVRSAQIVDGSIRTIDLRDNAVNAQRSPPIPWGARRSPKMLSALQRLRRTR
jgi:hypothetical protein